MPEVLLKKNPNPKPNNVRLSLSLTDMAYIMIKRFIREERVIFMVANGFSCLRFRTAAIMEKTGCRVVWVDKKMPGIHLADYRPVCDLLNCVKAVRYRKKRDNVIFLLTHAASSHKLPKQIKKAVPGVKVISNFYDFLQIFVPKKDIMKWAQYETKRSDKASSEYDHIEEMLSGGILDGLMHKDHKQGLNIVRNADCPTFWCPPSLPKCNFQVPEEPPEDNRSVFIGTLVPKFSHSRPAGIFEDNMLEVVWRHTVPRGFPMGVYCLRPHDAVLEEYKICWSEDEVKIHQGKPLEHLLPEICGKYRWGWMVQPFSHNTSGLEHMAISHPSKFYTYLALGVPVLVGPQLKSIAQIVKNENCGIIVEDEEWTRIDEVVKKYDYSALMKGVYRAREKYAQDKFMPGLTKFINEIFKAKPVLLEGQDDKNRPY